MFSRAEEEFARGMERLRERKLRKERKHGGRQQWALWLKLAAGHNTTAPHRLAIVTAELHTLNSSTHFSKCG